MTAKLLSFTLKSSPNLIKLGVIGTVDVSGGKDEVQPDFVNPGIMRGWRLLLRGPIAYLVSPPGWAREKQHPHEWDAKGPCIVHRLSSEDVIVRWSVSGEFDPDKLVRFDSDAFGLTEKAPAMSDEDLERATAPKAKAR